MKFSEQVYKIVRTIPKGSVMTYGQVAALLGQPRASQAVGWSLRALTLEEDDVPWWRVVNKKGYISINHGKGGIEKITQADLLIEDGVEVNEKFEIDMEKYLMMPLTSE